MYTITAKGNKKVCDCYTQEELSKFVGVLRGLGINHYIKESFNGVEKTIGMYLDGADYTFKG